MINEEIRPNDLLHLVFPPDGSRQDIHTRIVRRFWHLAAEGIQVPLGKAFHQLPQEDFAELYGLTNNYFVNPQDNDEGRITVAIASMFYCLEKGSTNFTLEEFLTEENIKAFCVSVGLYSLFVRGMITVNGEISMTNFFPEATFNLAGVKK